MIGQPSGAAAPRFLCLACGSHQFGPQARKRDCASPEPRMRSAIAPAITTNDEVRGNFTPTKVRSLIRKLRKEVKTNAAKPEEEGQ